jgi:hypothetical protein
MSDEIQKQATEGVTFRIPSSSINRLPGNIYEGKF